MALTITYNTQIKKPFPISATSRSIQLPDSLSLNRPTQPDEQPARGGCSSECMCGVSIPSVSSKAAAEPLAGPAAAALTRVQPLLGSYRIIARTSYNVSIDERRLIRDFKDYINSTAKCTFQTHGTRNSFDGSPDIVDDEIGYIHRWTPVYRAAVISKFYQLEAYCKAHPSRYTMMTLTTYQDGEYSVKMKGGVTSIEESFEMLKEGWRALSEWIRLHHHGLPYVWMFEPHKTGYPHVHVIFLGQIPESSQETIKNLWSVIYHIGSYHNGVKFTTPPINSVRNYLVKYFRKTLHEGKTGSKYEASTEGWTQGELLFNAVMWKHGWRLWGACHTLSQVMAKQPDATVSSYVWDYTELIDEHGEPHVTAVRDGFKIPAPPPFMEKSL